MHTPRGNTLTFAVTWNYIQCWFRVGVQSTDCCIAALSSAPPICLITSNCCLPCMRLQKKRPSNIYVYPKYGNCNVCWNDGQLSTFDVAYTRKPKFYLYSESIFISYLQLYVLYSDIANMSEVSKLPQRTLIVLTFGLVWWRMWDFRFSRRQIKNVCIMWVTTNMFRTKSTDSPWRARNAS
jgi:hypothetical protein